MAHILRPNISTSSSSIHATTSLTLDIPQEIIDAIVDEIARQLEGNKAALTHLRSCALVSKGFNHSVCRYLFAVIDIYYGNPNHQLSISRLRRILEASPRLVSYIAGLNIITSRDWDLPYLYQNWSSPGFSMSTVYRNQKSNIRDLGRRLGFSKDPKWQKDLIWILRMCTANLVYMLIAGKQTGFKIEYSSSWRIFSKEISDMLISIAQSNQHLQRLELSDIMDVPVTILSRKNGNTFTSFQLYNCTFVPLNPATPVSLLHPTKILSSQPPLINFGSIVGFALHELKVTNEIPDVAGSLAISHFPKLEFFSLGISGRRHEIFFLKHILTSDAPLLNELSIGLYRSESSWDWDSLITASEAENRSILPIEKLSVMNAQWPVNTATELRSALEAISTFFRCPILPTTIQEISIQVRVQMKRTIFAWHDGVLLPESDPITPEKFTTGMHLIDNVLSDQSQFPSLTKLELTILIISGSWCADFQENYQGEDEVFPRLASMGISIDMGICTSTFSNQV